MRQIALTAALALATALATSAHAGWYVSMHGTTDNLSWKANDGRNLVLSSSDGKGIQVVAIAPAGYDGLHKGDLITAVNGHASNHVADLLAFANAHMRDPVMLSVNRNGQQVDVALAAGELGALVHPHR